MQALIPRQHTLFCLLATMVTGLALMSPGAAVAQDRPNVVFMLSDNLGYGDLGSYGGGIIRGAPTPRLDELAAQGTRYTNFNVEAECTPSRSALMTGRYAVRSGTTRAMPLSSTKRPTTVSLARSRTSLTRPSRRPR